MVFLSSLSGYLVFKIYQNRGLLSLPRYRLLKYWFICWLLISLPILISSKTSLSLQAYGSYGRNIGFITSTNLAIVLVGFALISANKYLNQLLLVLSSIGIVTIIYGLVQTFNIDPLKLNNNSNSIVGFFGNPNFFSSMVGICLLASLGFYKELSQNKKFLVASIIYVLLGIYTILRSQSQQGFFVIIFGVGSFILIYLYKKYKFSLKFKFILIFSAFLSSLIMGGFLQKGPLSTLLYQDSITYRGDYWRAGIRMISEHPLFGVGFDSFGDYYFRYRDLTSATRRGPLIYTNSAHNYFIDFAANGGLFYLLLYLLIIVITLRSYIKVFKREVNLNLKLTALLAIWIGFQAQSLISPRQISLLVIGWTVSGLIIGYEINSRQISNLNSNSVTISKKSIKFIQAKSVMFITVGLLLCLPYFRADMQVKRGLQSLNLERIYASAFISPQDPDRMVFIANNLQAQGFNKEAISILISAVKLAPDNYDAWKLFSLVSTVTEEQKKFATENMKRLDPFNLELLNQ
jgi:O-antigen ligase